VLTIMVGVIAGLSAVLFTLAIDGIARFSFGFDPAPVRMFLVPVTVSVATGMLLAWVFPDVRGSGVPQTKAAYHLYRGVIPPHVPIGKFITGALCIGSGHSMGREGPSVQIGAGLASIIGRWLGLPTNRVRDLIPVGAAGALAAAFNTPIAAVLFALEEIIGDLNASLLGSTVVARSRRWSSNVRCSAISRCFGSPSITSSTQRNCWRTPRSAWLVASSRSRSARACWRYAVCFASCRRERGCSNRPSAD
jgi:CIC family chloride channel protein